MEVFIWIVISLLFIGSFIGVIVPVIPDALLLWIGFLLYQFALATTSLGWTFWVPMTLLTLLLIGLFSL